MSSEQIRKRRMNESALLRELHFTGSMQRGELSSRLGIRKSSVSNIVADFIERKVLVEERPGAIRSPIRLDNSRFRVVVAHVETTVVRVAEVMLDGAIQNEESVEMDPTAGPESILNLVSALLKKRVGRIPKELLIGVGVAVPGITDPLRGHGIHAVNMTGWKNVEAGNQISKELGISVAVENDVRCQLMGNAWFRSEVQQFKNLLYVSLQKGVACAAMVGGSPLLGRRFAAGEIGCLKAGAEERKCACGKTDCLQTYVSAPAILESIRNLRPQLDVNSLEELAAETELDPSVLIALDQVIVPLIPILAAAASILDPEAILLASDDVGFSEKLRPLVELRLNRELLGLYTQGVSVYVADNAEDSTLCGMASILIRKAFESGVVPSEGS